MSYSYVKTVFPDFKYSNIYDTKLYDNLNISQRNNSFEPIESENYYEFKNNKELNKPIQDIQQNIQQSVLNKSLHNFVNLETFQDNQKIYHPPNPMNNIPLQNNIIKETFDNNDHSQYTTHVLDCPICKELLMKQFNVENQRILNTEIMELISYIIFGLFIILLIDTYAK
jgi:hypothetical protein